MSKDTKKDIPVIQNSGAISPVINEKEQEFKNVLRHKKNDVCCIVGFAPSWKEAPYERNDIDFWGLNELYVYIDTLKPLPKFNMWFEVHDIKNSPSKQKKYHQDKLMSMDLPLITQQHWDKYPTSQPYPLQYIIDMVDSGFIIKKGTTTFNDYSNQISWMIALAIAMRYKEIYVYGVDMAQESEYQFQKSSCHFFMGMAIGRGIKLQIPSSCELCSGAGYYGFKTDNANRFKAKSRIQAQKESIMHLKQRQFEIEHELDEYKKELDDNLFLASKDQEIIGKELESAIMQKCVNAALLKYTETIPDNIEEIRKKKPGLIETYKKEIEIVNEKIKKLEEEKEGVEAKSKRRVRDFKVIKGVLKEELKRNKSDVNTLKGHIAENQKLINTNLV